MFPQYAVLTQLYNLYKDEIDLSGFFVISVQHLLASTGSLFETLMHMGLKPSNIYLTGKLYSTHEITKRKLKFLGIGVLDSTIPKKPGVYTNQLEKDISIMWHKLSENILPHAPIIILDDGGYVLKNIPDSILRNHTVYGIEQTTSGIRMQNIFAKFPVIHVASSAAKLIIEPPMISEEVKNHLGDVINKLDTHSIGVVGYGHIGRAVVEKFRDRYRIYVYDIAQRVVEKRFENIVYCESLSELYQRSKVIIGATGMDISDVSWLTNAQEDKVLISVSSSDIEFKSLLKYNNADLKEGAYNPLQDLHIQTPNGYMITIIRGGMVANFTGGADPSPGYMIQMTRGLLLSAIIQIVKNKTMLRTKSGAIMLSPILQSQVIKIWFRDQPQQLEEYPKDVIKGFNNINWIKRHSGGDFIQRTPRNLLRGKSDMLNN